MTWETGVSIVEYGLRRANELKIAQNDDFVADYKDYVNLAYWDIVGEFPWLWAMRYPPHTIITTPPINVTITSGADWPPFVTVSPDPGDVSMRKLVLEGESVPIRITEGAAGGTLKLFWPYPVNSTGMIFQDEYLVPEDVLLPTMLKSLMTGGEIEPLTADLFGSSYGRNISPGKVQSYTYLTGRIVQIAPWPSTPELLELWHTYLPPALDFSGAAATDTPIVPIHLRWIIADRALFYLLTDMEDNKGQLIIQNASLRLHQERDRHAAKWRPRFWIPQKYRVARNR